MCGRYSLDLEFSELRLGVQLSLIPSLSARYNIAPSAKAGFEVPIVIKGPPAKAECHLARWWFLPESWTETGKRIPTSFNARAEEVTRKPLWRNAFRTTRCLVPATGWREFKAGNGQRKRAFQFYTGQPFAFAGIWTARRSRKGKLIRSFAIITTEATPPQLRAIHDRMPVVMPHRLQDEWLMDDTNSHNILKRAVLSANANTQVYESSPYGNSVHHEGPECLAKVEQQELPW